MGKNRLGQWSRDRLVKHEFDFRIFRVQFRVRVYSLLYWVVLTALVPPNRDSAEQMFINIIAWGPNNIM